MKQAVILAGGKGTRLASVLNGLPKPLVDVCGKPLLLHQLELLCAHEFTDAVVMVNHRADAIREWLVGVDLPISVRLIDDGEPRGTAGAVTRAGRRHNLGRRICRRPRGVSRPDRSRDQRRLEGKHPEIDEWYNTARNHGAVGGKILGAGAGGFLALFAPEDRHEAIRRALPKLRAISVDFERTGSQIIFYQPTSSHQPVNRPRTS